MATDAPAPGLTARHVATAAAVLLVAHLLDGWAFSHLVLDGVNSKDWGRLLRVMGLEAIYPRRRTSAPAHRVYPYSLRNLAIERPDQVWSADITYVPLARGFMYLVAVLDWRSSSQVYLASAFLRTVVKNRLRSSPAGRDFQE